MINSLTELLANLNKAVTGAEITNSARICRRCWANFGRPSKRLTSVHDRRRPANDRWRAANARRSRKVEYPAESGAQELEPATKISGPQIRELVQNLTIASANFAEFSVEVKRRPSLLLWGTPPEAKPTPTPRRRR